MRTVDESIGVAERASDIDTTKKMIYEFENCNHWTGSFSVGGLAIARGIDDLTIGVGLYINERQTLS